MPVPIILYTLRMSSEEPRFEPAEPDPMDRISNDGLVVRQVQWAWVWSSVPWIILAGVLLYFGFLEEILTTLFLIVIVLPRYLRWRRTEYVLTEDTLFYQQGGLTGIQKYEVPISTLRDVRSRFGLFGKTLGYEAVDVMLDNGAVASLQYVPVLYGLGPLIRRLMDANPPADDPSDDTPPDDESEDGS